MQSYFVDRAIYCKTGQIITISSTIIQYRHGRIAFFKGQASLHNPPAGKPFNQGVGNSG